MLKTETDRAPGVCDAEGCESAPAPRIDMSDLRSLAPGWWGGELLVQRRGGLDVAAHCCAKCADALARQNRQARER